MAGDMFLKIDGIPGESTDDKHKDWIELESFQIAVTQDVSGARSTSGGASGGRCSYQDLSVSKQLDKASPKLASFCASGKNIGTVELSICHAAGDKSEYQFYKFEDCIVSSVNVASSHARPSEGVSFNFGKITHKYTEFDHKTNAKKGSIETWWSLTENKGG